MFQVAIPDRRRYLMKRFMVFLMVLLFLASGCSAPSSSSPSTSVPSLTPATPISPVPPQSTSSSPSLTPTTPISPVPPQSTSSSPSSPYINPITYHVARTVTINNTNAQANFLRIWLPLVTAWDSQVNITAGKTTPIPTNTSVEPHQTGNGLVFWEFNNEPSAGSSLVISDEFTYTCYQIKYQIDPGKIGTYDKSSADYELYTRPEKYIEADDTEIKDISQQLQQGKTNAYDVASSIYDWVVQYMTYQKVNGLKGAKFALDNHYGECGDYSALFSALCRAAGIPARPVVGRWATSVPDDWHVWAEFYLPNYGWVPADPAYGGMTGKANYFGSLDNKRLIFQKGFNLVLQPKPTFFSPDVGILQSHFWEYGGVPGQIAVNLDYSIKPIP
jgi:hypothetical protein